MSKIGIVVILCSAAIGAVYCSDSGATLMNMIALTFFGLAAFAGLLVVMSVTFCMLCLPVLEVIRFVFVTRKL